MGILNVTPDSFSDGGRHATVEAAVAHGMRLVEAGAVVIDVGGESTRPGAEPVPLAEEERRVLPVVERLAAECDAVISVDTSKPQLVRAAVAAGAHLVNDVRGLRDPGMLHVCAELGVPAVIMHMRGEPRTMQRDPRYHDVVTEVGEYLAERAAAALESGVPSVMIDPGIGFGKTLEHNLALLRALPRLVRAGRPVLVGASRKRLIATLAGDAPPEARDPGSLALHLFAAGRGAAMLRVHDVAGHVQALRVWETLHG